MLKRNFWIGGLLFAALPLAAQAVEYGFDKAHSHLGFDVRHIISRTEGEFKDYDGSFTFDEKDPAKAKVKVTLQAASIDTGFEKRDAHLRSADFFDVERFPTLSFVSTKVTAAGDRKYKVEGKLTIHGVTKPVTLDVEYLGTDNAFGSRIVAFTAKTTIDRRDFGLTWNKTLESGNLLVGNEVEITLEVSGVEKGAGPKK